MTHNLDSFLRRPLTTETCLQIYYEALRTIACQNLIPAPPDTVYSEPINGLAKKLGPEIYIAHPDEIRTVFSGVNLGTYKLIVDLYCSRINRSIQMVTTIVNRQQALEGRTPIHDLAIWAICLYLLRQHEDSIEVTKRYDDTNWRLEAVDWHTTVVDDEGESYAPSGVCVFDTETRKILSYQVCKKADLAKASTLALYNAVVSQRTPDRAASAGLIWRLPKTIDSNFDLDPKVKSFLETIHITHQQARNNNQFLKAIQGEWEKGLSNRKIPERNFSLILGNFLQRSSEFAQPVTGGEDGQDHVSSIGYHRDPLWQFPELRMLLARVPGTVNEIGCLRVGPLRYMDDVLTLWKKQAAEVTVSPTDQESAWVYDTQSHEIICQAVVKRVIK